MIDPKIVEALVAPVTDDAALTIDDEELLHEVAEGRPIKAIAAQGETTAADVADRSRSCPQVVRGASTETAGALKRLRMLHTANVDARTGEQLGSFPGASPRSFATKGAKSARPRTTRHHPHG